MSFRTKRLCTEAARPLSLAVRRRARLIDVSNSSFCEAVTYAELSAKEQGKEKLPCRSSTQLSVCSVSPR